MSPEMITMTRGADGRFTKLRQQQEETTADRGKENLTSGGKTFAAVVVNPGSAGLGAPTIDNPAEQIRHNKHWVYSGIRQIGQAVAGTKLEFFVRRQVEGTVGFPKLEDIAPDHPLLQLFSQVNPFRTVWEHWMLTMGFLELTGDVFWYLPKNALGVPSEIWIAHSQFMQVVPSATKYISHYVYNRNGKEIIFPADEIVHIKYPNPEDEWYGKSPLQAAADQVLTYESIKRTQKKSFDNGVFPGLVITASGSNMTQDQFETFRKDIKRLYGGVERSGKALVLEGDVKVQPVSLSPKEMGFLQSSKHGQDEILATYGVPAAMLGISKDVNRSSVEGMLVAFTKFTIEPKLRLIQEAINSYITPLYDEDIFAEFLVELPRDEQQWRENTNMLLDNGVVTINEIRADQGKAPVSWGDRPWLPSNLLQVGSPASEQEEPEPPEEGTEDVATGGGRARLALGGAARRAGAPLAGTAKAPPSASELVRLIYDQEEDAEAFADVSRKFVRKALKRGAQRELASEGKTPVFDLGTPAAQEFIRSKDTSYWEDTVTEATRQRLQNSLAQGLEEGEGVKELAARVEHQFKDVGRSRALNIARTETTGALNGGAQIVMEQEGIPSKEWVAVLDDFTRDDHSAADGQTVPIKRSFDVGGESLQYPGDTSAPPEQTVNCRCTSVGVIEEGKGAPQDRELTKATHVAVHRGLERPWARTLAAQFRRTGRKVLAKLRKVQGLPEEQEES